MKNGIFSMITAMLAMSFSTLSAQTVTITSTGAGSITDAIISSAISAAGLSSPSEATKLVLAGRMNFVDLATTIKKYPNGAQFNWSNVKEIDASAIVLDIAVMANNSLGSGTGAFQGYSKLETITLPENGGSDYIIGANALNACPKLTAINFPTTATVTQIGGNSFRNCTSLVSIEFPEGLTAIQPSAALAGCTSLKNVVIPSTTTIVGGGTFAGCTALETITMRATSVPSSGSNPFTNDAYSTLASKSFTLYVPSANVSNFKSSSYWGGWVTDKDVQVVAEVTTNIHSTKSESFNIIPVAEGFLLNNLPDNTKVDVYSITGSLVNSSVITGKQVIPVSGKGAYVVVANLIPQKAIKL